MILTLWVNKLLPHAGRRLWISYIFVIMVRIGLIGNVTSLQKYAGLLKKETGFEVIGKSSVGLMDNPGVSLMSVPEYARNALLEVSDALIVEKSAMVSFDMLKEAVRKYRHVYITDVPELIPSQCLELQKLVNEAGTIVQIRNPLMDTPFAGWVRANLQEPLYISHIESYRELPEKRRLFLRLLMFSYALFQTAPQKVRVTGVHQNESGFVFVNVRLDYASNSAVNFEILSPAGDESKTRIILPGKLLEVNPAGQITVNGALLHQDGSSKSELSHFLGNLTAGALEQGSGLSVLYPALITYDEIGRKLSQYIPWYSH